MSRINDHLQESKGRKEDYLTPTIHKFWMQEQITEQQFFDIADTFDILLFKTNRYICKGVRIVLDSDFDHAAMVLRFGGDNAEEIMFVHATSDSGVHLSSYKDIKE